MVDAGGRPGVRAGLKQIVQDYEARGVDLSEDPRLAEAILLDSFPESAAEIRALVEAIRSGAIQYMRDRSGQGSEFSIGGSASQLAESAGLREDLARWAAESWWSALSLGDSPTAEDRDAATAVPPVPPPGAAPPPPRSSAPPPPRSAEQLPPTTLPPPPRSAQGPPAAQPGTTPPPPWSAPVQTPAATTPPPLTTPPPSAGSSFPQAGAQQPQPPQPFQPGPAPTFAAPTEQAPLPPSFASPTEHAPPTAPTQQFAGAAATYPQSFQSPPPHQGPPSKGSRGKVVAGVIVVVLIVAYVATAAAAHLPPFKSASSTSTTTTTLFTHTSTTKPTTTTSTTSSTVPTASATLLKAIPNSFSSTCTAESASEINTDWPGASAADVCSPGSGQPSVVYAIFATESQAEESYLAVIAINGKALPKGFCTTTDNVQGTYTQNKQTVGDLACWENTTQNSQYLLWLHLSDHIVAETRANISLSQLITDWTQFGPS